MRMHLKRNNFSIVLVAFLLFFSCNEKASFNEYKSIASKGWKAGEKVVFSFEVKDTISSNNLFINIRNNDAYKYRNLYLITEMIFPNKTIVVDTLQYEMADKQGLFLGNGFTEIKENKLYYKENKRFPLTGNYLLKIRHAMRKNGEISSIPFLEGVLDVGLSIEK